MQRRVFPDRERGGVVANVLAGLFVAGVLLLLGLFFVGWQLSKEVRVETRESGSGKTIRVQTPIGTIKVDAREKSDPSHLGIPVYPKAELSSEDAKSASVQLDLGDQHADLHVAAAVYYTNDPVGEVRDYYKKQVPHAIVTKRGLEYSEEGYKRIIVIERSSGRTRIALASFGEPASN